VALAVGTQSPMTSAQKV